MTSVFAEYTPKSYPYNWVGTIHVHNMVGGTPSSPNVAEGWIKSKMADKDALIQSAVAQLMVDRGITMDEAQKEYDKTNINGFKRDKDGLYYEGRQLKAALKESISIAVAAGKIDQKGWGETRKFITKFFPEHVFVMEDRLHFGITEAAGIAQSFPLSRFGASILRQEYVEDVSFDFTITSDHDFSEEQWAMIWLTGEQNGLGASRSQGWGRFEVTRWEKTAA